MRRLLVFNQVSLDGYFVDRNGDMSWAHKQDPEWQEFVGENASRGGDLLFDKITYDLRRSSSHSTPGRVPGTYRPAIRHPAS